MRAFLYPGSQTFSYCEANLGAQESLEDLKEYTKCLVSSLSPIPIEGRTDRLQLLRSIADGCSEASPLPSVVDNGSKRAGLRMSMDNAKEQEEEDCTMIGCREAVEILTRLPKKGGCGTCCS